MFLLIDSICDICDFIGRATRTKTRGKCKKTCFYLLAGMAHLRGLQLTDLNLDACYLLTDAGLEVLKDMPLTSLSLAATSELTDACLAWLRGLPLTSLDLLQAFHGQTPANLEGLSGLPLRKLVLGGCSITLENFSYMSLEHLDLSHCGIFDPDLAHLKGMPIQVLNLDRCGNLTDAGLGFLRDLPALTDLGIGNCGGLTDAGLEALRVLPLQALSLRGNWQWLTDGGLSHLWGLPLTALDLVDVAHISGVGMAGFGGVALTFLGLSLFDCENGSLHSSLEFLRGVTSLEELTLQGCTDEVLKSYVKGLPNLKILALENCSKLTDAGLKSLMDLPLTALTLGDSNMKVTNLGMEFLMGLPLTSLSLEGCRKVTDEGLKYICDLPLRRLVLEKCDGLTNECLQHLAKIPKLLLLEVGGYSKFTNEALASCQDLNSWLSVSQ